MKKMLTSTLFVQRFSAIALLSLALASLTVQAEETAFERRLSRNLRSLEQNLDTLDRPSHSVRTEIGGLLREVQTNFSAANAFIADEKRQRWVYAPQRVIELAEAYRKKTNDPAFDHSSKGYLSDLARRRNSGKAAWEKIWSEYLPYAVGSSGLQVVTTVARLALEAATEEDIYSVELLDQAVGATRVGWVLADGRAGTKEYFEVLFALIAAQHLQVSWSEVIGHLYFHENLPGFEWVSSFLKGGYLEGLKQVYLKDEDLTWAQFEFQKIELQRAENQPASSEGQASEFVFEEILSEVFTEKLLPQLGDFVCDPTKSRLAIPYFLQLGKNQAIQELIRIAETFPSNRKSCGGGAHQAWFANELAKLRTQDTAVRKVLRVLAGYYFLFIEPFFPFELARFAVEENLPIWRFEERILAEGSEGVKLLFQRASLLDPFVNIIFDENLYDADDRQFQEEDFLFYLSQLQSSVPRVRQSALGALRGVREIPIIIPIIQSTLENDPDTNVRMVAIDQLVRAAPKDPRVRKYLLEQLRSLEDPRLRTRILSSSAALKLILSPSEIVQILEFVSDESDSDVRLSSVYAIRASALAARASYRKGELSLAKEFLPIIERLLPLLGEEEVQIAVVQVLGSFGELALPALPELLKRLTEDSMLLLQYAISEALGEIGFGHSDQECRRVLPLLIRNSQSIGSSRDSALQALSRTGECGLSIIPKLLRQGDRKSTHVAVRIAASSEHPEQELVKLVEPVLSPTLNCIDFDAKTARLFGSVARVKIPQLIELLGCDSYYSAALVLTGPELRGEAMPHLVQIVQNPHHPYREAALQVLASINRKALK